MQNMYGTCGKEIGVNKIKKNVNERMIVIKSEKYFEKELYESFFRIFCRSVSPESLFETQGGE